MDKANDKSSESLKTLTMKELLEYYKTKHLDFAKRIKGASDEEISALEGLIGKKLDEDFKVFLKYLGCDNGGIFEGKAKAFKDKESCTTYDLKYDFTIETITKHYRWLCGKKKRGDKKLSRQNRFSENFILIGAQHHSQDYGSYYLDCRALEKPPIVNIDEFNEIVPLAPSFKDFVITYAFRGERF